MMNIVIPLGKTLLRAGVINATIHDYTTDTDYEFVRVGLLEFQFGPVGNVLTNYVIDELKMEPYPEYGDSMTIEDFIRDVESTCLTNYDGSGCYATDKEMTNITVRPSDVWYGILDHQWSHIVWFNK